MLERDSRSIILGNLSWLHTHRKLWSFYFKTTTFPLNCSLKYIIATSIYSNRRVYLREMLLFHLHFGQFGTWQCSCLFFVYYRFCCFKVSLAESKTSYRAINTSCVVSTNNRKRIITTLKDKISTSLKIQINLIVVQIPRQLSTVFC